MGAIVSCRSNVHSTPTIPAPFASSKQVDCRTIQHIMGATTICGQPQRVVVLGSNALEPLLALNIQPIGFADHVAYLESNYTHPKEQIPYLGQYILQPLANLGSAYSPSFEAILKLRPDLILGSEGNDARQYQILSKIAPTVLLKWFDAEANLRTIAQIFDRSKQAENLSSNISHMIETARQDFAPIVKDKPKILLLNASGMQQIYLGNYGHGLCSLLLQELGFELVDVPGIQEPRPGTLVPISVETLPNLNQADHIVLLGSDFSRSNGKTDFEDHQLANLKQAWEKNAIAQTLNASKNGNVSFIPAYLCLGLSGPIGTELYLNELKRQLLPKSHS